MLNSPAAQTEPHPKDALGSGMDGLRAKARSLRQLAAGILDGDFRDGLLTLAADYDRQADVATTRMVGCLEREGYVVLRAADAGTA
jgi:hypothetical protein